MDRRTLLTGLALLPHITSLIAMPARAERIGENTPFPLLNAERLATLTESERQGWVDYLKRSETQKAADMQALRDERRGLSLIPADPATGHDGASMPLKQPPTWYASEEARLIAANIISFQTPAGGWGKNQSRKGALREKGQAFVAGNGARYVVKADFDAPADPDWNYVGTIDNDATTTEIRFLAKVATATGEAPPATAALRGFEYLLAAQFPNGGWPQVWPLQGGYHDALTLNDDAMISVLALLSEAGAGQGDFAFVPEALRTRLGQAAQAGIRVLIRAQVVIDGRPTLWAQQYDALTLRPASARNFEPPALSSSESASVLLFLMKRRDPSAEMRTAIDSGVAQFKALRIEGKTFTEVSATEGRHLRDEPGAPGLWARYYDLVTLRPIFGDRDRGVFDNVEDVSFERRNGYTWFNTAGQKVLDAYVKWQKRYG